jgi:hypothetical protein
MIARPGLFYITQCIGLGVSCDPYISLKPVGLAPVFFAQRLPSEFSLFRRLPAPRQEASNYPVPAVFATRAARV